MFSPLKNGGFSIIMYSYVTYPLCKGGWADRNRPLLMTKKRILSLLLCAVMSLLLAAPALAAYDTRYQDDWVYICVDPGHGGIDSGCVATYDGRQYTERDICMQIGLYLKEELESRSLPAVFRISTQSEKSPSGSRNAALFLVITSERQARPLPDSACIGTEEGSSNAKAACGRQSRKRRVKRLRNVFFIEIGILRNKFFYYVILSGVVLCSLLYRKFFSGSIPFIMPHCEIRHCLL